MKFFQILQVCLLAVAVLATDGNKEESNNEDGRTAERDIVDSPVRAAAESAAQSLCRINIPALKAQIDNVIEEKFSKQPVIQLFDLWTDGNRNLKIQQINGGTLGSQGRVLDTIPLGNGGRDKTSSVLAYRKNYKAYHKTGLGTIFLNLKKLFPCVKKAFPICGRFTGEENGFLGGKALIEAADSGGDFKIFGKSVATYGIAFQGCPVLHGTQGCLPKQFKVTITCFLPRSCI